MVVAALVSLVVAVDGDLSEGARLYEAMQFRAAEARLRAAKATVSDEGERRQVLELLARTLAAQGRLKEAEDAYAELLALAPHAEAPTEVAPKLTEAFERAKVRLYPKGLVRLFPKPAGAERGVELLDPWRDVDRLELTRPEAEPMALPLERGVAVPVPPNVADARVVAFGRDRLLAELRLEAPSPLAEVPPTAVTAPSPTRAAEAPARWPEWSLTAVAVAAVATGAGLAVSSGADLDAARAATYGSETRALGVRAQQKAIAANVLVGTGVASGLAVGALWAFRW